MRKIVITICIAAIAACNTSENKKEYILHDSVPSASITTESRFSKITFASAKDTTCHMPLTAGVEDTVSVDGKTYGFCSKECKDAFVQTLQAKTTQGTER